MTYEDELLDRFAEMAMDTVAQLPGQAVAEWCDACWLVAIEMKKARDRICTTAKPAAEHVPPFPEIDGLPEKPSEIAAKRLGYPPFGYEERS